MDPISDRLTQDRTQELNDMNSILAATTIQTIGVIAAVLGVVGSIIWFLLLRSGIEALRDIKYTSEDKK